jgi:conserved oligomeric Golgi complex subunit 5
MSPPSGQSQIVTTKTTKTQSVTSLKQKLDSISSNTNTNNNIINLANELSKELNISIDDLVNESFDIRSLTTVLMKTNELNQHLTTLNHNIRSLDKEICEQVSLHHEDLLHQAVHIETLEEMLDIVQTRIMSLKSTSEKMKQKIIGPFNELQLRIRQLTRLQAACDTLRRIKGVLNHSAKLRTHIKIGVKDIVKSAQCLNELEFLLKDFDSNGIEIIENDVHLFHKTRHQVLEEAEEMLKNGLEHQDQSQIGTSLQVFYSLAVLTSNIGAALNANEKSFQKKCQQNLDTTALTLQSTTSTGLISSSSGTNLSTKSGFPGRATMPNVGSMSQFRAQLWINIEKVMEDLYDSCCQVIQLQSILEKKKDSHTNIFYAEDINFNDIYKTKMYIGDNDSSKHLSFDSIYAQLDIVEDKNKKTIQFLYEHWRRLTTILNQTLQTACNQSNYIKQTFHYEYPKLLKLYNSLWSRLLQQSVLIDKYRYDTTATTNNNNNNNNNNLFTSYDLLRKCFIELENSYINRSLSQLFDPINLIFSQGNDKQINRNDIDSFVKAIQIQLNTLQYDQLSDNKSIIQDNTNTIHVYSNVFSEKIVSNICKSIQMYGNKCDQVLNSLNVEITNLRRTQLDSVNNNNSSNSNQDHNHVTLLPSMLQVKNLDYVNATQQLLDQLTNLFDPENQIIKGLLTQKLSEVKQLFFLNNLTSFLLIQYL